MHNTLYRYKDFGLAKTLISCEQPILNSFNDININNNREFGNLNVKGCVEFDENDPERKIFFPIMETNLNSTFWCHESMFSLEKHEDFEIYYGKINFDDELYINDSFKLQNIS